MPSILTFSTRISPDFQKSMPRIKECMFRWKGHPTGCTKVYLEYCQYPHLQRSSLPLLPAETSTLSDGDFYVLASTTGIETSRAWFRMMVKRVFVWADAIPGLWHPTKKGCQLAFTPHGRLMWLTSESFKKYQQCMDKSSAGGSQMRCTTQDSPGHCSRLQTSRWILKMRL